ncbi:MAG: putative transport system ATP-binding protein, partial [Caproiciproducens sp.]|nr:putative transport system ATP-binding protein [Caproiciproducens sp.]
MSGKKVIEMHDIIKSFYLGTPNELQILHGINLNIYEGEFVSIVGASGSGKSTLMNIIGALDRPTSGQYILDGMPLDKMDSNELSQIRNKKIGFVFQTFNLIPRSTSLGNVELPMLYAGQPRRKRAARAMELLELVEMS